MIRCDWAQPGLESIGRDAAVVIVDVFSFGTAVTLAVERGAIVYPWPGAAAGAADFARRQSAILCTNRRSPGHHRCCLRDRAPRERQL